MLTTGNQLKAARMLAEIDQLPLAEHAKVSIGTIRNMEAQGGGTLKSSLATIRAVQAVLEAAGVEFLNHGQPGVRLRPTTGAPAHPKPVGPATDAVDAMDEAITKDRTKGKGGDGGAARHGKRLASVKETGEEVPQEQWERFEAADKKPSK